MSGRVELWWAHAGDAEQRRALVRVLLARRLNCRTDAVELRANASGRPELHRPRARLRFSVASSGPVTLVAITDGAAVGVDVERAANGAGLDRAQHLFLSAAEQEDVAALPPHARPRELLRRFTVKEALAKALGTGLTDELPALTVCPPWHGGPLPTAGDVVAALVVRGGWDACVQRRVSRPLPSLRSPPAGSGP